jgi:hypothetical protein
VPGKARQGGKAVGAPHYNGLGEMLVLKALGSGIAVEFHMRFGRLESLARRLSLLGLLGLTALGGTLGGANAAESLFDVAKVAVDTKAKNAVAARANGMLQAEMRGFKVVLERIVPLNMQQQLPDFTKEEVELLVSGIAVRKEQASTTRYIALLDVRFDPYAVKQLLTSYGIPFSENRAPAVSILPLMLSGEGVFAQGPEQWHQAWEDLDLSHSVTPGTILRPQADLDAATVRAAISGDGDALAVLQGAYGYGGLVVAVGQVKDGQFVTTLAGEDGVGMITFKHSNPVGGDTKKAARVAAAASLAAIESRWKLEEAGAATPTEAAYGENPPARGAETAQPTATREVARRAVALVEFSGLRDWQQIRSKLTQIAGIQGLEIDSLQARRAAISFEFAGPLDRLQAALGQSGFVLEDRDGTLVLRSQ